MHLSIKLKPVVIILFCFLTGISVGCKKYLDVKSNSARITPSTLKSLQELLDDSYIMNFSTNSYAEASADDYFITQDTYNSITEQARKIYTWNNFIYTFDNDWAAGYVPVYNANLVLESLEKINKTSENEKDWNTIKGAALLFRANQFLTLVWTYGKAYDSSYSTKELGIVLRTSPDPTIPSIRSNLEICYRQIINDLQESLKYLSQTFSHPMRPSLPAAYGLLARTYLSMAKFDTAKYYANLALSGFNGLLDYNDAGIVNPDSDFPFKRFNKETIFFTQLKNYQVTLNPYYAIIDTSLFISFEENDLRKKAYFTEISGNYMRFKGSYCESTDLFSGIATDELYLIRAECNARLGNREAALEDLNTLLETRWEKGTFIPVQASSDDEALNLILLERRKELIMRGLRWIDIKRLNLISPDITIRRSVDGNVIHLNPNDKRYALPLPADIVNVTNIPQNEY